MTEPTLLLLWAAMWGLCAFAYARGTAYGLRFLEDEALIDTGAREFHVELLLGPPGRNYQRFYAAHSPRFGRSTTLLMISAHLMASAVIFLLPVVLAQHLAA